jgi:putative hemolysin
MRKKSEIAVLLALAMLLAVSVNAMPNPSAGYCTDLGYDYIEIKEEDGSEA